MGCPQAVENGTGAPREAVRQGEEQCALAAESLDQAPGRHPGFGGDVRQRELMRTALAHGALRRREDLIIGDLLTSCRHGLTNAK